MDQIENRVTVVETHIDHLRSDVAVLKTDVATLKADVGTLKIDVAVIKATMATREFVRSYVFRVVVGTGAALAALDVVLKFWERLFT